MTHARPDVPAGPCHAPDAGIGLAFIFIVWCACPWYSPPWLHHTEPRRTGPWPQREPTKP